MLLGSVSPSAGLIQPLLHAGGSAGIGKATAIAFSDNGAIVTITGRRQERLDAVTSQLKKVHSLEFHPLESLHEKPEMALFMSQALSQWSDICVQPGQTLHLRFFAQLLSPQQALLGH